MLTQILSFVIQYKTIFIIMGLVVGLWYWHVTAIKTAVQARDVYWVNYIENSPVKSDTTIIHHYIPRKDTSGVAAGVAIIDQLYKIKIDSLLATVTNKDSVISALSTPYMGSIKDESFGKLAVTYYPLNASKNKFDWLLTERPPIDSSFIIINNEKMVAIPFRKTAISGNLTPAGLVYAGLKYRVSEFWVVGMNYQISGKSVGSKWTDKLQIGIDYYFY
jgi:hypothetical protein